MPQRERKPHHLSHLSNSRVEIGQQSLEIDNRWAAIDAVSLTSAVICRVWQAEQVIPPSRCRLGRMRKTDRKAIAVRRIGQIAISGEAVRKEWLTVRLLQGLQPCQRNYP